MRYAVYRVYIQAVGVAVLTGFNTQTLEKCDITANLPAFHPCRRPLSPAFAVSAGPDADPQQQKDPANRTLIDRSSPAACCCVPSRLGAIANCA